MDFTDKVVLITGASSGIGAATAIAFARLNATVVLGGRNEERLKDTANQCELLGLAPEKILIVVGNLCEEEHCSNIINQAVQKYGRLDVLVNNAGINNITKAVSMTVRDLESTFTSHVKSVVMVTANGIPHLKNKGVAYGMAKAAVNVYSQSLAQELGPYGIRVNAILPAAIETPFFTRSGLSSETFEKFKKQQSNSYALRRIGKAAEVANFVVFLASDAASFITGSLLPIDGGCLGHTHI